MRVIAILLAAGSARRFRADKLHALYRGKPLYRHALDALVSSPAVEETLLVVHPLFPRPENLERLRVVVNPEHEEGMASSLRAGVRAAPVDADAYLVALADMPAVGGELIVSLIGFAVESSKEIIVPVCRGRRGHPVLFRASLRQRLLELRGDVGARGILEESPELVGLFATEDPGVLLDIDRPEDLGRPAGAARA
jgi:molybdenum cofactor cytidylyltransferase